MCSSLPQGSPGVDTPDDADERWSKSLLARKRQNALDEIYFCHRRRGEFVRQRPGGGLPRHIARSARAARCLPKV